MLEPIYFGPDRNGHGAVYKASETGFDITLLRSFSLKRNGKPIEIKSQKARAILGYLLLNGTGYETRDRICSLLWSETGATNARVSLRQAVSTLNKTLNSAQPGVFKAIRYELRIDFTYFDVDAWTITEQLKQQKIHDLLLYSNRIIDTLLDNFDDLDPEFRVWLHIQRQTLQEQIIRMLEDYLPTVNESGHKKIYQALLNLDPTHEPACRGLMRTYAQDGDMANALRVYKTLYELLEQEYGEEPSEETQDLVAAIKMRELGVREENDHQIDLVSEHKIAEPIATLSSYQKTDITRRPVQKLTIGIEDFVTDGVSEDKNYLIQGFRHELIACLIRFRELTIVDLKSTRTTDIKTYNELPHYTINTTIYQHRDTLILILTLKESSTDTYIWSDRFELRLDSWFEVQHSIARRITMALNINLSAERLQQASSRPDISLDIYDRWLRAENLTLLFSPDAHDRARKIFQSIIKVNPGFPGAYLGLAEIENCRHLINPGLRRTPHRIQKGLALAKKAVQLEPLDSRAHLCLAWSYALYKQYEQAKRNFMHAFELNENSPWTLISSSSGLAFCNEKELAIRLADQALSLDLSPSPAHWGYQLVTRFLCGDYQACIDAAERADNMIWGGAWKTAALYHMKHENRAGAEAKKIVDYIRYNWMTVSKACDLEIVRWLLQCFPISCIEDWSLLQTGLKGAGLPVPESPEY